MIGKAADKIGNYLNQVLGFSISVSTSLTGAFMALVVPLWFLSQKYKDTFHTIKKNKYLWALLILVGLHFTGLLYGEASVKEALGMLKNAAELMLIFMLFPFFLEEKTRRGALNVFLLTMTAVMLLSYLLYFGFLPESQFIKGNPNDAAVFLNRIDQNIFMAFCAFIFAVRVRESIGWENKIVYIILAIMAVVNITVMVGGKQGYIVLFFLTSYYFFSIFRWKGLLVGVLVIIVLGTLTYLTPSGRMHQSFKDLFVTMTDKELLDWHAEETRKTSAGLRLSFYKNTVKIIFENPVAGVGTGGFARAYSEIIQDTKMPSADSPHSEYLRVTSELGLIGFFAFLFLFYTQWRLANDLPSKYDRIIAVGFILTILSAALFNGILTAYHKRIFYIWMSALLLGGYESSLEKNEKYEDNGYSNNKK